MLPAPNSPRYRAAGWRSFVVTSALVRRCSSETLRFVRRRRPRDPCKGFETSSAEADAPGVALQSSAAAQTPGRSRRHRSCAEYVEFSAGPKKTSGARIETRAGVTPAVVTSSSPDSACRSTRVLGPSPQASPSEIDRDLLRLLLVEGSESFVAELGELLARHRGERSGAPLDGPRTASST